MYNVYVSARAHTHTHYTPTHPLSHTHARAHTHVCVETKKRICARIRMTYTELLHQRMTSAMVRIIRLMITNLFSLMLLLSSTLYIL